MESRRVVVTGLGLVTPVGIGVEETWKNLLQGKSGAKKLTRFNTTDFASKIAGEITDFNPEDWMDKRDARRLARFIQFAQAATKMAFEMAGLDENNHDPLRSGVLIGSGIGGLEEIENEKEKLLAKGPKRISPFFIPSQIINMASGYVSIQFGLKGPNSAVATACSTGNHAIGDASSIIRRGDAEIMVAGGSESTLSPLALGGFSIMRALTTRNDEPEKASRPFDQDRDGFLIAEGAGILVLEELEHAKKRGASILAECIGYGMTGDAFHFTAPDKTGDGPARVMTAAIKSAGINPEDVDYLNAHGTATPLGDPIEVTAIKKTFGEHAYKVAVTSTKSMVGHLLGAAGGVEAAFTILTLRDQVIPHTINLENPDPDFKLNFVANTSREVKVNYALSNSFGFGGTNSSLLFKRFNG